MEYAFSDKRWLTKQEIKLKKKNLEKNGLGFHKSGMWDKVVDIEKCHLQIDTLIFFFRVSSWHLSQVPKIIREPEKSISKGNIRWPAPSSLCKMPRRCRFPYTKRKPPFPAPSSLAPIAPEEIALSYKSSICVLVTIEETPLLDIHV